MLERSTAASRIRNGTQRLLALCACRMRDAGEGEQFKKRHPMQRRKVFAKQSVLVRGW